MFEPFNDHAVALKPLMALVSKEVWEVRDNVFYKNSFACDEEANPLIP